MTEIKNEYAFLIIGKTTESTEAQEFKRYIGMASSKVLAVNPKKEELDKLMGFESANEPEYVVDGENGREARINFIVRTDPEQNNGVEITSRLMFTLRNTPAYNRDQTKVQVIDKYGNSTWASVEDARAGKKLLTSDGKEQRIDTSYRMAGVGEADLVAFLKTYLGVPPAFNYVNGSWVKKENADDYVFTLEQVKEYFKGNFSELKDAIALQPNNKIKLLYGVRTSTNEDGTTRQFQAVASRGDLMLPNNAGTRGYERVEKQLASMKASGAYPNTEFVVQDLQEYVVKPTNLNKPVENNDMESPW